MEKPRAAWPVLAQKAKERVEALWSQVATERTKLEKLVASRERIQTMYDNYRHKSEEKLKSTHLISQATIERQFLSQLLTLMERVDKEIEGARTTLETTKKTLLEAEQARIKMDALVEKDLRAHQEYLRKRDQKQMDALGITLFNMRA